MKDFVASNGEKLTMDWARLEYTRTVGVSPVFLAYYNILSNTCLHKGLAQPGKSYHHNL